MERINQIERDVSILQWMVGTTITLQLLTLGIVVRQAEQVAQLATRLAAIAAKAGAP